ncbi:bifunctional hydroxymethylpyrimidine kinase/phosphomethylpyrimidine kinase [Pontibacillus yanchengensis]|uniref:Hydroxymethylpyrimidine/phosphomethylpyrimidine kinase n=1 Tax=Pontibacillus yanchengensis Y32 TaxID=1385514 RepID=A0A0A2T644_9BACI|nr:bifunctional hydroxymethylpyrimidine kinase/phosphomethylpyrimidine kinase [Pontibacillus yanchengensis]KGP70964.1 phosphomethylpyrimidine kinase [Pontibacillus yanchengensis Y32]
MTISKALTIAGSDSGGGAGIQADLKTFQELNVYGMSVITAVTAQNTKGVHGVHSMPIQSVRAQLDAIGTDLFPNALKTGMLGSSDIIEAIAERIDFYNMTQLVVDPVMVAKGGQKLLDDNAINTILEKLLPFTKIITPNIPEAEVLTGRSINSLEDQKRAAHLIQSYGAEVVVVKGGHGNSSEVVDVVYDGSQYTLLTGNRYHTMNTHGTGCTFSAAITAQLAKGESIIDAILVAKQFIEAAIRENLHIGSGHGPTNHWAFRETEDARISTIKKQIVKL